MSKQLYFKGFHEYVDHEDRATWGNKSFSAKKDTRIQGFQNGPPKIKEKESFRLKEATGSRGSKTELLTKNDIVHRIVCFHNIPL